MCYVNTSSPRTVPFGTCPLNVNTHTKTSNCGLCTSGLNDPFPLSQKLCKPDFSMTSAAVTALSKSCLLTENQHRRIAHLVLVRHFDEFFVCLLNPVSVVAVSGVDQTVHSPEILSPSRLNLVLASRAPHGETTSNSTIKPSKIPASVLPTKCSQIMRRRASLCPVPPGRGFSPELSASSIPSKRRRTPLQSTVSRMPAKFTNPIQTSPRCFRSSCRYRRCCRFRSAAAAAL